MFDTLFGWRKASKCKKLIRHVQCRLKLLKNKRGSIIRQLRDDIAQLLELGQEQRAFARVEQLFKDKTIMAAYNLLDHFCEFIIIHLPYIRRHRDCPNDINEAVSSLIFAAARFGDLPELQMFRKLFKERYGHKFAVTASELLTGNLVNSQLIENLSIKSIPYDVKLGLLDEIARDYSIRRETIPHLRSYLRSCCSSSCFSIPHQKLEVERTTTTTACKSSYQFPEISVVYLDDIEEFNPTIKDGIGKDQRIFKFKSIYMPTRENLGYTCTVEQIEDGRAQSRSSRKRKNLSHKRLNRRSLCWGIQFSHSSMSPSLNTNDAESALYYGVPCDYSSIEDTPASEVDKPNVEAKGLGNILHAYKRNIHYSKRNIHYSDKGHDFNHKKKHPLARQDDSKYGWSSYSGCRVGRDVVFDCSLECPCYFFTSDKIEFKSPMTNMRSMKEDRFKQEGMSDFRVCASSHCSFSSVTSSLTQRWRQPPYWRAETMPSKWSKNTATDGVIHSASFQFKQANHWSGSSSSSSSSHVHPKLPDYDDLAAKFMALKKEHLQRKFQTG